MTTANATNPETNVVSETNVVLETPTARPRTIRPPKTEKPSVAFLARNTTELIRELTARGLDATKLQRFRDKVVGGERPPVPTSPSGFAAIELPNKMSVSRRASQNGQRPAASTPMGGAKGWFLLGSVEVPSGVIIRQGNSEPRKNNTWNLVHPETGVVIHLTGRSTELDPESGGGQLLQMEVAMLHQPERNSNATTRGDLDYTNPDGEVSQVVKMAAELIAHHHPQFLPTALRFAPRTNNRNNVPTPPSPPLSRQGDLADTLG